MVQKYNKTLKNTIFATKTFIIMETLIHFAKENFQLITLLVGLLGVIVAVITLLHEINTHKRKKDNK